MKEWLCPETGFFHYFYGKTFPSTPPTIPLYENLCLALSFFNLKTQEGVEEGKKLILKILPYQNSEGSFPVYLHEYPQTHDLFVGAYLLPPLYWILHDFGSVLTREIKSKIEACCLRGGEFLYNQYLEKQPSGHIAVKTISTLTAIGALLNKKEWTRLQLPQNLSFTQWSSSQHLADLYLASKDYARFLQGVWHHPTESYCGVAFKEFQEGFEPKITLLDFIMGSHHALTPHHTQAALIREKLQTAPPAYPYRAEGHEEGMKWLIRQEETWAAALVSKKEPSTLYSQPGMHLLRLLMKGESTHSFILPGNQLHSFDFEEKDKTLILYLTLSSEWNGNDKDLTREISFYADLKLVHAFDKGTVFNLGQPLTFSNLTMTIENYQGMGEFKGQILRGNRPSQILSDQVYDYKISLRTLRREPTCTLKVTLNIS